MSVTAINLEDRQRLKQIQEILVELGDGMKQVVDTSLEYAKETQVPILIRNVTKGHESAVALAEVLEEQGESLEDTRRIYDRIEEQMG